jgi:hypothetical protein
MRLGVVEELGVEARLLEQQGHACLGIYCSGCAAGIAMVVLGPTTKDAPDFDWQSDHDVLLAIENHQRQHRAFA